MSSARHRDASGRSPSGRPAVQVLCVDWLTSEAFSRVELRDACLGALLGALNAVA